MSKKKPAPQSANPADKSGAKLLARARKQGTPLIDPSVTGADSYIATFLWQGKKSPLLMGDFNNWGYGGDPIPLNKLAEGETALWSVSLEFPPEAYLEYAFFDKLDRVADPFNTHSIYNGMNGNNHFFHTPGYEHTALVKAKRSAPRGTVTKHIVDGGHLIVGGKRAVHLYEPPTALNPDGRPYPIMLVYDGDDYLKRAKLTVIVDNLIAQGRIRPIALAILEQSKTARFVEYACNEALVGFIMRHVLPLAQENLNIIRGIPGVHGVMGASMGGLMSLYTAFRLPDVFGKVLSQSGAFGFDVEGHQMVIYDLIREGDTRPLTVWMDVGRYEFLYAPNQRMRDLLSTRGYALHYREFAAGHNYTAWRDDVAHGLETLFPPESGK